MSYDRGTSETAPIGGGVSSVVNRTYIFSYQQPLLFRFTITNTQQVHLIFICLDAVSGVLRVRAWYAAHCPCVQFYVLTIFFRVFPHFSDG